jgi:phenylpropionate dioxygenase-like ring-hydroxylating dioxygenase large terminal subunit
MVPNVGDYYTLAWRDDAQVLVRNASGVELLSNICRHRQAIMLSGRGNAPNIVCPIHRWTYDLKGGLLGAPHFDEQPCAKLHSTPLTNWRGLLFDGGRDIARDLDGIGVARDFDFSGYMLDRVEIKELKYNWKTFIEVYLEDYHVGPFHPGWAVRHPRHCAGTQRALFGADRRSQRRAGSWESKAYDVQGGAEYYQGRCPRTAPSGRPSTRT